MDVSKSRTPSQSIVVLMLTRVDGLEAPGARASVAVALTVVAVAAAPEVSRAQRAEGPGEEKPAPRGEKSVAKQLGTYEPASLRELVPEDREVEEVTLSALMQRANRKAPAIRRARARLDKGKARVEGTDVVTKYEPVVSVGLERFPMGEFSFGEMKAGVFQRFTIAGEQAARLETAQKRRTVVEKRLGEVRWFVHAEVHRLYNRALVDIERLRLAHRTKGFFEHLLEIVKTRFEAGESTKIAVQLSKVELARAKQNFVRAQSDLLSRLESLEEVSGWGAESLPIPEGELPETRGSLEESNMRQTARQNYPRVETFQAAVEVAESAYEYQKKKSWPDPGVGLFYKLKSPNNGPNVGGLVAQLSLPIPIWNRNKLGRMVSSAHHRVTETRLATLRQKLDPKVADAVQSLNAAARQVHVYDEEVVATLKIELELLRQGYQAGEFDITDVTVAQQRLLKSRQRALEARDDYFEAAARIEQLTGTEFWTSIQTPIDEEE